MAKKVRYNGGTESYYNCSNPSILVVGQEYTVIKEDVYPWQTDYILEGLYGKFNSVWFDDVTDDQPSLKKELSFPIALLWVFLLLFFS